MNTNYAWMIKLTKILIEIIPLSQDDKFELFDKMKDNLVDEKNPFLLESKNFKFSKKILKN